MDRHDSLGDELVVSDVFVLGDEFLCDLVILYSQLVPILHEMPEGPIKIEKFVEVRSYGRIFFCQFIEIFNAFVYFPFHHEDNSFGEELKFLNLRRADLQKCCSIDMIECRVKIAILYFGFGDLDQRPCDRFFMIVVANASLKCQKGLLFVAVCHLQQPSIVFQLAVLCLKLG